MTYARIVDGVAVEIITWNPEGRYPDDFVWVECPDDTVAGATYDGSEFTNPVEPEPTEPSEPAPQYRTVLSPGEFKRQFNLEERIVIDVARLGGDTQEATTLKIALDIFYSDIEGSESINVNDADVQQGLQFMVDKSFITPERKAVILKGRLEQPA